MTVAAPARTATVALVGNPNAGKTSVFNALTGAQQRIGNYPGVTVEKFEGEMAIGDCRVTVVDVPGLYSLQPISVDESVAVKTITSADQPDGVDLFVYVLDASNLERNLYLFTQMAELRRPMVVALTQTDLIEADGIRVDTARLSGLLGVEVVPVIAFKNQGVAELKEAIDRSLNEEARLPDIDVGFPKVVNGAAERLVEHFARSGIEVSRKDARCMILEDHCTTAEKFREIPELWNAIEGEKTVVLGESGKGHTIDAQARFAWAARVKREILGDSTGKAKRVTDRIDDVLTHRVFGFAIFVGLMYLVFQSIYTFAGPIMDLIDTGVSWLAETVRPWLDSMPFLQSLLVDGIIVGVGSVLVFLPQIIILFFFISVLEGTGYLARAAFLMDRLLGWCGLNGRAFIPLLSSFACAIPGVMAARVLPDERSRLITILVAPLMSCSARLPVYVLMIGAFIEPKYGAGWAGFALFAMHFVGIAVAIPIVFFLNRTMMKGRRLPFILELPKYQWPKWRDIWLTIKSRVKVFVSTAGTIIVAMSVLIWALLSFPQSEAADTRYKQDYAALPAARQETTSLENYVSERQRANSYLGRFGRTLEPIFAPAGFDWRLTTAILAAFPAREVVVPAMGILFGQGEADDVESRDLRKAIADARWPDGRPLVNVWTAISLMVFFALCCQCMATLAAVRREAGSWKWALISFGYMTTLAYLAAVFVQWIGRVLG